MPTREMRPQVSISGNRRVAEQSETAKEDSAVMGGVLVLSRLRGTSPYVLCRAFYQRTQSGILSLPVGKGRWPTATGCVHTCTGVRPVLAGGPVRKYPSGAISPL
jgi:hypothetical protein